VLQGIRVVGTGVFVAQPYIGTKLAEFAAEVIHLERRGGETFRRFAPHLTRGPRVHGCDTAEINKNKLSMGSIQAVTHLDHMGFRRADIWSQ